MLTINRDNYETWLMLYLDNELSASERKAVEAFCTTNPDVQDELNSLKEVMLQPDLPVYMPGKERLLMPEMWNEEALNRHQQQLLMMADNELPNGDKVLLENELETNPLLSKEWTVLQKAILAATIPVEMPGKENLLRHEKTRAIPIGRILRMAAAAAILGFGWFFTQDFINDSEEIDEATELTVVDQSEINQEEQVKTPVSLPNSIDAASTAENKVISQKELATANFVEDQSPAIKKPKLIEQKQQPYEGPKDIVLSENTIEKQYDINNHDIVTKIPTISYVDIPGVEQIETPIVSQTVNVEPAAVVIESQAIQAYQVVDADDIDADESISIAGARISKQKIRSVYRNITRPLARTFDKTPAPRTEIR